MKFLKQYQKFNLKIKLKFKQNNGYQNNKN